jgi:xanthine dehydrogenase YagS FAD-binding subunit
MIRFPKTLDDAVAEGEIVRAGGTDLTERRHLKIANGPVADLRDLPGLDAIEWSGGVRLGAKVRIATLAADPKIRAAYPGLAAAAGGLATPQIRAVGTLGGNLLQRTRCWYYRNPDAHCLKKGGSKCLARAGDHLYHSCIDLGPCVAVHPSTLAAALLTYDASIDVHGHDPMSIVQLLGDGSDPMRENALPAGALLTGVRLPAPVAAERAAYFRTISRSRAEWPLVEAVVRLVVEDTTIKSCAVAVGGVAPIPLRLTQVEDALTGQAAAGPTYEAAAKLAREGTSPLPMTGYKVELLEGTVLETLERAHHATPLDPRATAAAVADPPGGSTPEAEAAG